MTGAGSIIILCSTLFKKSQSPKRVSPGHVYHIVPWWVTIAKMPRFSDVFVYDHVDHMHQSKWVFTECHLLKKVGPHEVQMRFDQIMFDVQGMVLFFENHPMGELAEKYGPFSLTTQ